MTSNYMNKNVFIECVAFTIISIMMCDPHITRLQLSTFIITFFLYQQRYY
jgi:hypothetical protein